MSEAHELAILEGLAPAYLVANSYNLCYYLGGRWYIVRVDSFVVVHSRGAG
jgi:hypothetical protein